MVFGHIIGEEELFQLVEEVEALNKNWNNVADEETNAAILAAIKGE